ncbi:MAG TPA: AraC family transcriptional regulator [Cellvibrionaceae bacterium]
MNAVLFNIHDVALLLRVGECSLLAVLFLAHRGSKPYSNLLLALFLLLNAMIALHLLILWGEAFRFLAFDFSPNIFFVFNFACFLEGPILYWYIRSVIYKDFKFVPTDAFHLIPAAATPVLLYFFYYRRPIEIKEGIALNFKDYGAIEPLFDWLVHPEKIVIVLYGVACLYQLFKYRKLLKQNYSDIERIDLTWLVLLIGGFMASWVCFLAAHIVGAFQFAPIAEALAVMANYVLFILINILIFYSLIYSDLFEGINESKSEGENTARDEITPEQLAIIQNAMEKEKLYLNPRLTLEEFSKQTGLHSRLVSAAINRTLNQNFHEFVNRYRVEEVKRVLSAADSQALAITDIATKAGFNSKAAFNRFFKKFTDMTPTQFREHEQKPL